MKSLKNFMMVIKKISMLFKKRKILVTHNGSFHADDIFATATLSLLYNGSVKIVRTRDKGKIKNADIVYDVGGIYDPSKNLFDHHQNGGAGKRENGIEYASFGLIWKHFGLQLCDGDKEVWEIIEDKIVAPIDAIDNGIDIVTPVYKDIMPYDLEQAFLVYSPTWEESNDDIDKIFKEQVNKICELLKREISVAKSEVKGKNLILDVYNNAKDKRILISETPFPRYLFQKIVSELPEPVYFICPSGHNEVLWKIETVRKNGHTMDSRKLFPESWRGHFGGDSKLKEITTVDDAMFCHRSGFLMIAKSREGAIKLAELALLA